MKDLSRFKTAMLKILFKIYPRYRISNHVCMTINEIERLLESFQHGPPDFCRRVQTVVEERQDKCLSLPANTSTFYSGYQEKETDLF